VLTYWLFLAIRFLAARLPEQARHAVGGGAAFMAFAALSGKRANVYRNMRVLLTGSTLPGSPQTEHRARRIGRRSMTAYGRAMADFIAYQPLIQGARLGVLAMEGLDELETVLAAGRGAVFATAHFGHWDMAAVGLAHRFPGKITAVAETFTNPRLDKLVVDQRLSYGVEVVPMENVRRMVRILREGRVLGMLADRPLAGDEGVPVRFFGREARFPGGTAVLAGLARCPIFVGSLRRREDGSFEGMVLPPIEPARTGNRAADVAATMQMVADQLEAVIRRAPHQWYMFRDMWPEVTPSVAPAGRLRRRHLAVASALLGSLVIGRVLRTGHETLADAGSQANGSQGR
jgi:KDO2-lipid IV(A) lauroyltransferase